MKFQFHHNKFQNKYRIPSHRMPGWDYAGTGYYFITMVTQNRACYLGDIENGKMVSSDFGKIVETEWHRSFKIRGELILDEWIMMPNHIHAIVIVQNVGNVDDVVHLETHGRASPQSNGHMPNRLPKSISSFVAGFKSSVNTKINDYIDRGNHVESLPSIKFNKHNHFFQPNYHDCIIGNELDYYRIKKYIQDNPLNWDIDDLNLPG